MPGLRYNESCWVQKAFRIMSELPIPIRNLFSREPGRPTDEREDSLKGLIELLRGLDAGDLGCSMRFWRG